VKIQSNLPKTTYDTSRFENDAVVVDKDLVPSFGDCGCVGQVVVVKRSL